MSEFMKTNNEFQFFIIGKLYTLENPFQVFIDLAV